MDDLICRGLIKCPSAVSKESYRLLSFRRLTQQRKHAPGIVEIGAGVVADLVPPRQMSGGPNLLADLDRRTFDASGFGPTRTTHASRL